MKIIGRNDLCWCNSGKKYKKCHLQSDQRGETSPPGVAKVVKNPTVLPGGVSPTLDVPEEIGLPEYAISGKPTDKKISCKKTDEDQINRMRHAGKVARNVLDTVLRHVKVGITTDELDKIAHARTLELGAYPSPLNYMGFPKSICTSVNEVVVHGIPDGRALVDGDVVNCDITIYVDGMHGDCSETVFVGNVDEASKKLVQVTWECLLKGIDVVKPGELFTTIGIFRIIICIFTRSIQPFKLFPKGPINITDFRVFKKATHKKVPVIFSFMIFLLYLVKRLRVYLK